MWRNVKESGLVTSYDELPSASFCLG
jgi:hypothetical protein